MTHKVVIYDYYTTSKGEAYEAMKLHFRLMAQGFDVKKSTTSAADGSPALHQLWVEFETAEEAVLFKLTYL